MFTQCCVGVLSTAHENEPWSGSKDATCGAAAALTVGEQVEVTGGLRGEERLVVNPSDEVRDGVRVSVTEQK